MAAGAKVPFRLYWLPYAESVEAVRAKTRSPGSRFSCKPPAVPILMMFFTL